MHSYHVFSVEGNGKPLTPRSAQEGVWAQI